MSRVKVRPYLVSKGEEGDFGIVVRSTRFNSQGYPLVTSEPLEERFPTATKARSHLREHFGAVATDIATS